MSINYLFDDLFTVKQIDPDGKKFDRVSRLIAKGENHESDLLLDFHVESFPVHLSDKFNVLLVSSLNLNGSPSPSTYDQSGSETLAASYDYVMHGKVYKHEEATGGRIACFISFGGLLMRLESEANNLCRILPNTNVYLLAKKI